MVKYETNDYVPIFYGFSVHDNDVEAALNRNAQFCEQKTFLHLFPFEVHVKDFSTYYICLISITFLKKTYFFPKQIKGNLSMKLSW